MLKVPRSYIKGVAIEVDGTYDLENAPFIVQNDNTPKKQPPPVKKKHITRFLCGISKYLFKWIWWVSENEITEPVTEPPPPKPDGFIGREQHITKFVEFLIGGSSKGVFLVTGYRGMGKTSFVNKVLSKYAGSPGKEKNLIKPIRLTLAQNNPKELDILRLMVMSVFDEFKKHLEKNGLNKLGTIKTKLYWLQHLLVFIIVFSSPLMLILWKSNHIYAFYNSLSGLKFKLLVLYVILVITFFLMYFFALFNLKNSKYKLLLKGNAANRITWLVERCNAALGEEVTNNEGGLNTFNFKLFNEEKRTKQYAMVNNKEIEYELQMFLERAKEDYGLEFIFVFDELDKVEPALNSLGSEFLESLDTKGKRRNYENELIERRVAIVSIIAGLKNFFTTAEARFIFIAGREMFDATLADISDRQSSISSIFTFVFYIESLLKEKNNHNNPSLSSAIEDYLKYLLFGDISEKSLFEMLGTFKVSGTESIEPLSSEEQGKLYFIFQNFITYLTYRSNGSPKKLIKEIHEFIVLEDKINQIKIDQEGQDIIFENPNQTTSKRANGKRYLYFNYYNQYRIGFINYLYRPFLIKYGRSFKLFSDNIVVSTPYLFDHLLKFHPFAFSISNLELLPEILSSNKTPTLRPHIRHIIDYLGANHIREIEIGLFDYKFYSRTHNEITFLSRIFEPEAAALNYTLDESYSIKRLVINKIKELRSDYSSSAGGADFGKQIFSIAHLNGILGDLYFFDQEYDDAIVAYSDAIRTISYERSSTLSLRDFIVLTRTKLKMGLCFEKINAYDDALAQFVDNNLDASRLMNYRLNEGVTVVIDRKDDVKPNEIENTGDTPGVASMKQFIYDTAIYRSAALSDLLQIILQGFLSQLFIQEKKSVAGISEYKLFTTLGSFFKITEGFKLQESRNHIIKANAFLHAGNLIYFKNSDRRIRLDDEKINEAYTQNLPERLKVNLTVLIEKYDELFCNYQGFRKPVLALYLYILGMVETLNYGNHKKMGPNMVTSPSDKKIIEADVIIKNIIEKENIVFHLLDLLTKEESEEGKVSRGIYYNYIASFLGNIGDCLLSNCNNRSDQYKSISLDVVFLNERKGVGVSFSADEFVCSVRRPAKKIFKDKRIDELFSAEAFTDANLNDDNVLFDAFLKPSQKDEFSMADVLRSYYLAGRFYLKQGRISSCSFQYRKILYTMRLVLNRHNKPGLSKSFCIMLKNKILRPCLEFTSQNAHSTDRHMFLKAIANLKPDLDDFAINNLSNHPETKEIILAYNYIKIKLGISEINISSLISPANSIATQQSRLLELDLYAKYLEEKNTTDIESDFRSTGEGEESQSEILNGTAYLYSMLSILQILDIYGSDYWLGHSYLAYTHFRVATYLSNLAENTGMIEEQIKSLLGKGSYASLDIGYHFSKAKELYEKAEQLHSAGDAYKNMIEDMIYLEDDFNESAYHFGAALDRYMMTNRMFTERIKTCNYEIKKRMLGLQDEKY